MIQIMNGDVLKADADVLVNTVNCVGVMGRGIALQFRKAFPQNFNAYKTMCEKEELHPGMIFVHDLGSFVRPRYIFNFPTKRHWKEKSRMEDIESGLSALVQEVRKRSVKSIAIPPLGCGLGGLKWKDVQPKIERAFQELPDVKVYIYAPVGAPAAVGMAKEKREPQMTVGRASLVGLMQRYLSAAMDPVVSLLELHKLMYFMQEAGENLKLNYQKAPYGPYANNLRHVLSHIESHFISGYGDAEDTPSKLIELRPDASRIAENFIKGHSDTCQRFDHVVNLIEGFETPYGMELLSTVHWVATRENARTAEDAVLKTYAWNKRKTRFKEDHIKIAWGVLDRKGWLLTKQNGL